MGKIVAIIIVMIGMVLGANLIAPVHTATSLINTGQGYSAGVSALTALIPLLAIVVLMIFAVKAIEV